jgi:hypothetical protein
LEHLLLENNSTLWNKNFVKYIFLLSPPLTVSFKQIISVHDHKILFFHLIELEEGIEFENIQLKNQLEIQKYRLVVLGNNILSPILWTSEPNEKVVSDFLGCQEPKQTS